jgi:hypothetical protein
VQGKRALIVVNVLGGIGVLGSYAVGLITHPAIRDQLWGGVPLELRPAYTVTMLAAAAGYFAFSYYVVFVLDESRTQVGRTYGFGVFPWIYAGILLPSALWMPLTFRMLETPGPLLWLAIRLCLAAVGGCSLALIAAVASAQPRAGTGGARVAAILGAIAFAVQTAVLDALVWPYYFPSSS